MWSVQGWASLILSPQDALSPPAYPMHTKLSRISRLMYTNLNLLRKFPHNPSAKFSKSLSHLTRISSAFQAPSNRSFKAPPPAGEPKRTATHRSLKLQIGNESSSSNETQLPNPPIIPLPIKLQCRAQLSVVPTTWTQSWSKSIYSTIGVVFSGRSRVAGLAADTCLYYKVNLLHLLSFLKYKTPILRFSLWKFLQFYFLTFYFS